MFDPAPQARADLAPGTFYAVSGEAEWIYYGQVTPEKNIGFFRHRSRHVEAAEVVIGKPILSIVAVNHPSIGRALRAGLWAKLGRFPVASGLEAPRPSVQWPAGSLTVTVFSSEGIEYDTRVEDPAIQCFERAASYSAVHHIQARLVADYGEEDATWSVGGPIWRERRKMEELARRNPDAPWLQLPDDWVFSDVR